MIKETICSVIPTITTSRDDLPNLYVDTSLLRGILLVEPDITLLSAEALQLANSNYCVTTAFSDREIFVLRHTKAVALAILSASLGDLHLRAVAEAVRWQWPLARILVLGHAASVLEDHLYDEEIDPSPEPKQLLDDLERLYEGSWNQRSNTLDWNVGRSGACAARSSMRETILRGLPASRRA